MQYRGLEHLLGGIEMVGAQLDASDLEVLRSFAEDAASSDALAVEVERRVVTARRG
jgi:hypothetical protein